MSRLVFSHNLGQPLTFHLKTSKSSNTKAWTSLRGTSEEKTKFGHCGGEILFPCCGGFHPHHSSVFFGGGRYYFQNSVALIFVIDSNDSERWDSVQREHLRTLEADELRGLPVLVFCNKQDLPMSLPAGEVAFRSGIEAFCVSHGNPFWFQPCSFAHGDESELTQAFRWLFAMISRGK